MTDHEKFTLMTSMTEESDPDVLSAFLSLAGETIYNYVDPYRISTKEKVIDRYGGVQAKLAAYMINKQGAEGQTSHSENGISRVYESGDIPNSLLRELTPICGAVK